MVASASGSNGPEGVMMAGARAAIAALPLKPAPGIPEIALHLSTPQAGIRGLARSDPNGFGTPYWAHCWGGGLALARHVLDHPQIVSGRRVLDLGAGSGLVAIAAAMAGAAHVNAADIDPYAELAMAANRAANGVKFDIVVDDLLAKPPQPVDLVLVGDLFYAPGLAERVTLWLDLCARAGQAILVGDPFRAALPQARLAPTAVMTVSDFGSAAPVEAGVFHWLGTGGSDSRMGTKSGSGSGTRGAQ